MSDNPHAKHRERMRARYRREGLDGFADHEVLEFLLYYCYQRCDTNERAHKMLKEFNTLHNLFETDVETLMKTLKCTENVATLLNLIPALTNRYYRGKWERKVIFDDEKIAGEYALDLFAGETVEKFYVLCLDRRRSLINTLMISEGTIDESAVYIREIMSAVFKNNATSIILMHNHPGGSAPPSRSDMEATRQIVEALYAVHIETIDHIISAGDTYYSFAARRQIVHGYY